MLSCYVFSTGNQPQPPPSSFSGRHRKPVCDVCGAVASGFYYGAVTCTRCFGFFKRAICNKRVYACEQQQVCTVNRKSRFRCHYCHFQKCLAMGMSGDCVPQVFPFSVHTKLLSKFLSTKNLYSNLSFKFWQEVFKGCECYEYRLIECKSYNF